MGKLNTHWTEASVEDFLYRISTDYIRQLEKVMGGAGVNQAKLAKKLGITEGRVSQVFGNPGNLTLRKIIEYARSLGKKVSIVCYDDDDLENQSGPVNSQIFTACWERAGKPTDFFALMDRQASAATVSFSRKEGNTYRYQNKESANISFGSVLEILTCAQGVASNAPGKEITLNARCADGGTNTISL